MSSPSSSSSPDQSRPLNCIARDLEPTDVFTGEQPSGGGGGTIYTPNGDELPVRKDIAYHSKELSWGYIGSGPRQTAIALLAYCYSDQTAQHPKAVIAVTKEIVASLSDSFELSVDRIQTVVSDTVNRLGVKP